MTPKNNSKEKQKAPPAVIVIFGASGDLTQRKLIPSLYSLACDNLLAKETYVIGIGRTEFDDEGFRDHLKDGAREHSRLTGERFSAEWEKFSKHLSYLVGDYYESDTYLRLSKKLEKFDQESGTEGNHLFHMAIPPQVFQDVVEQLGKSGLNHSDRGWSRIVVEKPFGRDLESARSLNKTIHQHFEEDQIFRIDHYLGKETVQNLLTLRFANAIFEPIWNRNYIDHVQITVAESFGINDRGGYYDKSGILRDIFQNHMMQLLALTAIDPPVAYEADSFRDEKVNILRAVRPVERSLRGQYGGDDTNKAYTEEKDVDPNSDTATFAALKLYIDNWRWKYVPFYLRSGKHLERKTTNIAIQFKEVPHLMFPVEKNNPIPPNILYLCIQPNEGISLRLQTKQPGTGMQTHSADIDYNFAQDFEKRELPEAYERLLLEAISGDQTLFTRADEIELAWKIIDPILDEWRSDSAPSCYHYPPGSWGPEEAENFIQQDGREWHYGCGE